MDLVSPEKTQDLDLEKPKTFLDQKVIDASLGESPSCNEPDGKMQRRLKARHVSMIAIGGTIGTGLFVGSGEALLKGGPVGLLLGYSVMGTVVYSMMVALGEMVTMFPVTGAFIHYTTRFVDPALGFAVGWNYWYSFAVTLPTEITAAGIVIKYWTQSVNVAVWITIFLVATTTVNFFGVKWYGEAEFFCSAIKVAAIVGLIILGIVLDLGGGPNHDRIGFRYWISPGAFNQLNEIPGSTGRFLAFWSVLVQAAFSYQGTEIVALAAGEAENPRRNVPKAINKVFYRILIFYIGGMTVVGLLVPFTSPQLLGGSSDATSSPFVIAIKSAGISALPDIVNVVILTAVFSAANSDLYAGSRILFGLSSDRMAPRIFSHCTAKGIPVAGLGLTAMFGLLAYMNVDTSGGTVFEWFSNISSITGLVTWWSILLAYIRFFHGLKYNGMDRNSFAYRAPYQPWLSYFGFTMITLIIIFNGFEVFLSGKWSISKFVSAYIALPIFILFFMGWKIFHKTGFVRLHEMDFDTGRRELDLMDAMEREKEVEAVGTLHKFWQWVCLASSTLLRFGPKILQLITPHVR
ncbi:hypothetical protein PGTUg99_006712 [Puccinia graminis f. sp. tritici]|uniref:Amino acid permease/ SLC12A domain-containing protein n=1 Tax=Puccinia graminis f. sp. tritici TaxID=56615 RepID=A0A5B0NJ32_PUCGR|nr:hypothetical protein PGTUg99_006712 [Puccinia graminis f. sp. tritici]